MTLAIIVKPDTNTRALVVSSFTWSFVLYCRFIDCNIKITKITWSEIDTY